MGDSKKFIVFCTAVCLTLVINAHSNKTNSTNITKISSFSVIAGNINRFTYTKKSITLLKNNVEQFLPLGSLDDKISYKSSDPNIATVDANGNIYGVSNGTATIVATNSNKETTSLKVKVKSKILVIDPGHGSRDTGAGKGSLHEKDIVMDISTNCKKQLNNYCGLTTYLTRTDDTLISLSGRAMIAKNKGADFFISMHVNASSAHIDKGALVIVSQSTYKKSYYKESSILAECLLKRLANYGFHNKGIVTRSSKKDRYSFDNSMADYYGVIKHCINRGIPSIIIEHGFIDSSDYNLLNTHKKRLDIAISDANGIADYLKLKKATANTNDPVLVTKLELLASNKHLKKGDSFNIPVNAYPLIANNTKLSYKSNKPEVVTVNDNGQVLANNTGKATITISTTDGSDLSKSFNITVK